MKNLLTESPSWKLLEQHFQQIKNNSLRTMFREDPSRGNRFCVEDLGIYFDFSKHRINDGTLGCFFSLPGKEVWMKKLKPCLRATGSTLPKTGLFFIPLCGRRKDLSSCSMA